jgi:putative methylase
MSQPISLYELASILFYLKEHPNPRWHLEQSSILPTIAASILLKAYPNITGRVVYDLGCGTGRFAIGAALLGAKRVCGVDVDKKALRVARENARFVEAETVHKLAPIAWLCQDVRKLRAECDTVVQFPPFTKDVLFFRRALSIAKIVYSVHKHDAKTLAKLRNVARYRADLTISEEFSFWPPWKRLDMWGHKIILVIAKR